MQNNNIEAITSDDEIDLVELMLVLWREKWAIILITFLCALLGVAYALLASEKWTSDAEIIPVDGIKITQFLALQREYNMINASDDAAISIGSGQLFSELRKALVGQDVRRAFFEQSTIYQELLAKEHKADEVSEESKRKLLAQLANGQLKIKLPDEKDKESQFGIKLSFSAEEAALAQKTLSEFLDYANQFVAQEVKKDLLNSMKQREQEYALARQISKQNTDITQDVQVQNLGRALNIAEKAGIEQFQMPLDVQQNASLPYIAMSEAKVPLSDSKLSDSPYLFMLGKNYLSSQLNIIKENDPVYSTGYYMLEHKTQWMNELIQKSEKMDAIDTYQYLSSPSYPVTREAPKRSLIVLIALLLGGMFGVVFVLLRNAVRQKGV